MEVVAERITKTFGNFEALRDVTVRVPSGELIALLGPSGSGKTTLLRVIAGLEAPDVGEVRYGGRVVTDVPVRKRRIGFVFQSYALFEHLDVFENIAFGLRVQKAPEEKVRERVCRLLELVRLDHLAKRLPAQLSGGQRQRVALARALAPEPSLLLLDEPFGALDAKVRQELREWLRKVHEHLHVTSVFVTHDQAEAFELADRVVVMDGGRVAQIGTAQELWEQPASPFVIDFLGHVHGFEGEVRGGRACYGPFAEPCELPEGTKVQAWVRHRDFLIREKPEPGTAQVTVLRLTALGPVTRLTCEAAGIGEFRIDTAPAHVDALGLQRGSRLHVMPRQVRIFTKESSAQPAAAGKPAERPGLLRRLRRSPA